MKNGIQELKLLCLVILIFIIIQVRIALVHTKDTIPHPCPNSLPAPTLYHLRLRPPPPEHLPIHASTFTKVLQLLQRRRFHHRPATTSGLPHGALAANDPGVKVAPVIKLVAGSCYRLERRFQWGLEPCLSHSGVYKRTAPRSAKWSATPLRISVRVGVHLTRRVAVASTPIPRP